MNYYIEVLQLSSIIKNEKQLYCLLTLTEKTTVIIPFCSLQILLAEMTLGFI